ncbi:membrane dipeptidase [Novosphingobium flavum]|uniref:Membrane dipeptidase n=1 Tax=Novosphingobium flavum TaxID=1778672 RepID=A0A7X1KN67_9SPHN|nr:dipeptidase [Novosphingobium flavum]MBC2667108.1 membrane dipeptidase [Novosphingobium flavum]
MRLRSLLAPALATAILASPALAAPPRSPEEIAAAALKAAPVWDGHNDVPEQLRERWHDVLAKFDFADTSGTADPAKGYIAMHTDLARLRRGKVGAQFWSVYVSAGLTDQQAVQAVMEQIDVTRRLIARYPADLQFADNAADVEKALKAGKIASLLGMEGGYAIGNSPGVLRQFRALGVRYMTLSHFRSTSWADSATDAPKNNGLSPFGKDVVREMQRIGMLVDLSHTSTRTMLDALDVARAPVIFSHSGARAVADHARNVPDEVLARIKANGGIVMVVSLPAYVSQKARDWALDRAAEKARLDARFSEAPDQAKAALAEWEKAHPVPPATLSDLADHVDHIVKVAGIDHVGVGGDFDGMDTMTEGFADVSAYPALFAELARRGYAQADLEKIASRNMLRILKAADAYAAAHAADPALESPTVF